MSTEIPLMLKNHRFVRKVCANIKSFISIEFNSIKTNNMFIKNQVI